MTTAATFRGNKASTVNEQRIARFAGTVIGLTTLLWAFLLSGAVGEYVMASGPWHVAVHALSLLSAVAVYLYCRHLNYRTSASGLLCFTAIAFFFADVALGLQYSPYFGVALIAWGASSRRPILAGTGVLAIGAAIVSRFEHELSAVVVGACGLIVAATLWPKWSAGKSKVGDR